MIFSNSYSKSGSFRVTALKVSLTNKTRHKNCANFTFSKLFEVSFMENSTHL